MPKITDYSLEIYNFPETIINEQDIIDHFENLNVKII